MHVTKLTRIASGATAYGSASRASVEKNKKLLNEVAASGLRSDGICCKFEPMHVTKLTHIASGATTNGSARSRIPSNSSTELKVLLKTIHEHSDIEIRRRLSLYDDNRTTFG